MAAKSSPFHWRFSSLVRTLVFVALLFGVFALVHFELGTPGGGSRLGEPNQGISAQEENQAPPSRGDSGREMGHTTLDDQASRSSGDSSDAKTKNADSIGAPVKPAVAKDPSALREGLKRDVPSPPVENLSEEQLAELPGLVSRVEAGLSDSDRISAIQLLSTWGARPEITRALLSAAQEGSDEVRLAAVSAFVVLRDYGAVPALSQIARDDPSPQVREEAEKVADYLEHSQVYP